MKLAKNIDTVLSIGYIVLTIFLVVCSVLMLGGGELIMGEVGGAAEHLNTDGNSPGAGYILIGTLAGMGFGFLTGIMAVIFGVCCGFLAVVFLGMSILSFVRISKYNATGDALYLRKNLTGKCICNTLALMLILLLVIGEVTVGGVLFLVLLIAAEVLLLRLRSIVAMSR